MKKVNSEGDILIGILLSEINVFTDDQREINTFTNDSPAY